MNKYQRSVKGATIDVYDVLMAFGVTNPADAHAIKKLLMPGQRGVKGANQDRREAIQAIERAISLESPEAEPRTMTATVGQPVLSTQLVEP